MRQWGTVCVTVQGSHFGFGRHGLLPRRRMRTAAVQGRYDGPECRRKNAWESKNSRARACSGDRTLIGMQTLHPSAPVISHKKNDVRVGAGLLRTSQGGHAPHLAREEWDGPCVARELAHTCSTSADNHGATAAVHVEGQHHGGVSWLLAAPVGGLAFLHAGIACWEGAVARSLALPPTSPPAVQDMFSSSLQASTNPLPLSESKWCGCTSCSWVSCFHGARTRSRHAGTLARMHVAGRPPLHRSPQASILQNGCNSTARTL